MCGAELLWVRKKKTNLVHQKHDYEETTILNNKCQNQIFGSDLSTLYKKYGKLKNMLPTRFVLIIFL